MSEIEHLKRAVAAISNVDHGRPWGEPRTSAFEAKHGFVFPNPYRDMLADVASTPFGIWEPGGGDAEWNTLATAGLPFPLVAGWLHEEEPDSDHKFSLMAKLLHGTLPLFDAGCGHVDLLILTGELRGEVWTRTDVGIFPWQKCGADALCENRPGFTDWLVTLDGRRRRGEL